MLIKRKKLNIVLQGYIAYTNKEEGSWYTMFQLLSVPDRVCFLRF